MMRNATARGALGLLLLGAALGAERAVEHASATDRPPLKAPLAGIPLTLGQWVGQDEPVDEKVARESQATEFLNRSYVHRDHPGRRISLWMNYSEFGLNMRHSPEVCLPSGGWTKLESLTRVARVAAPDGRDHPITLLGYGRGELVQRVGFWYYIFGEGRIERFVRGLPISSRSSHGRTTRGSGLTVELFYPGDSDLDDATVRDFAEALLAELEPRLPDDRAPYHVP